MLLACFWSHLTKNATYSIAKGVDSNLDIVLRVEIFEDWNYSKLLPQLGKSLSIVGSWKTKFFQSAHGLCKIRFGQFFIISTTTTNDLTIVNTGSW